jgi:hypothetical protein
MIVRIEPGMIPYGERMQCLCARGYHGHPEGCPDYGSGECPPGQELIDRVLDFGGELYVIFTEFAIGDFAKRMKEAHPGWTERQCCNPSLWQSATRKAQREEERRAVREHGLTKIVQSPGAHGVDVTGLMKKMGITLHWDWPPKRSRLYFVSIGGHPCRG